GGLAAARPGKTRKVTSDLQSACAFCSAEAGRRQRRSPTTRFKPSAGELSPGRDGQTILAGTPPALSFRRVQDELPKGGRPRLTRSQVYLDAWWGQRVRVEMES